MTSYIYVNSGFMLGYCLVWMRLNCSKKLYVSEFRTPQKASPQEVRAQPLPEEARLRGYMHIADSTDFLEEARIKARTAIMVMLGLDDASI